MQLNKQQDFQDNTTKLIDFLCTGCGDANYKSMHDLFYAEIYSEEKPIINCVSEFKIFIRSVYGRGQNINAEMIDKMIYTCNICGLIHLLEELFLEPINKKIYLMKLNEAVSQGLRGSNFIEWNNKGRRHISLITTPKKGL